MLEYIVIVILMFQGMSVISLQPSFKLGGCGRIHPDGIKLNLADSEKLHIGEFPWKVIISVSENKRSLMFDGSLIHPQVVLTGANPIYESNLVSLPPGLDHYPKIKRMYVIQGIKSSTPTGLKVRAGYQKTETMTEASAYQDRNVSRIIIHEDFNDINSRNDFALLFLSEAFTLADNVNTVCLPNSEPFLDKSRCFATGWKHHFFGEVVTNDTCQESLRTVPSLGEHYSLPESSVCARGRNPKYPCGAIKGNPLVCRLHGNQSHFTQVGIFSWTAGCNKNDVPDVYGNVATARVWIDEQMKKMGFEISSYIYTSGKKNEEITPSSFEPVGTYSKFSSDFFPAERKNTNVTPPTFQRKGCGYRHLNRVELRSPGSSETYFGEFPWMVAILMKEDGVENVFLTGGSLIHPRVVLTASFFISRKKPWDLKARAGEWHTKESKKKFSHQDRKVSEMIINEGKDDPSDRQYLALLVLTKPFRLTKKINTICLPDPQTIFNSSNCFVSGWGEYLSGKQNQDPMKQVELPIVNHSACQKTISKAFGEHFKLSPNAICAGGSPGQLVCNGASGNPLVCPLLKEPDRSVQVGTFSWVAECESTPGVYGNISALRLWIDMKMEELHLNKSTYVESSNNLSA